MAETFYRFHGDHAPTFSADNAHSGLWGGEFSADGSQAECLYCGGEGESYGESCSECDGEGWVDLQVGYSCCHTAGELVRYFRGHLCVGPDGPGDGSVVVFTGEQVGTGFDGEPLAVPTGRIRRITWRQLQDEATEEDK